MTNAVSSARPPDPLSAFLEQLYRRTASGIKMGLEVEIALLEQLGKPQQGLHAIHVAGTNGKGSVCALLDSALRQQGFHVGLYTSPHLVRFHERIRVDGKSIDDGDLVDEVRRVDEADRIQAVRPSGREATFFEFATAVAFDYFRRRQVDLCVLETGLGGRLDATNVVEPLLTVITRVAIDHTAYLGQTLEQIAGEKAGIIKPGVAVICGAMEDEAREVIRRVARERKAPFVAADEAVTVRALRPAENGQTVRVETVGEVYGPLVLPLLGKHQLENVATAVAALEYLGAISPWACTEEAICKGLETVWWPARCQILSRDPLVMLDVAHNPDAARVLAESLKNLAGRRDVGLVMGLLADKDLAGFLRPLVPRVKTCWAVPIQSERALPLDQLVAGIRAAGLEVRGCALAEALKQAEDWARSCGGIICIAGSLFLAGEVFRLIGVENLDVPFPPAEKGWRARD